MRILATLLLLTTATLAADFSGSWKGTLKLKTSDGAVVQEGTAFLNLKQSGATVSGQAGTDEDSQEVKNGKADGDILTFHVETDEGPIQVKLTLENGELTGQANGQMEGRKIIAELKFKKQ
jgi:hypothetical protein